MLPLCDSGQQPEVTVTDCKSWESQIDDEEPPESSPEITLCSLKGHPWHPTKLWSCLAAKSHSQWQSATFRTVAQPAQRCIKSCEFVMWQARGYWEFINYLGSFFFVKALITPPLPSCLPNRVCFCPKMVCFSFFSFVSQDLHATSDTLICVLCSCIVKRICKVLTLTHVRLDLQAIQETLQWQCECQLTSRCSAVRFGWVHAGLTHFQGVIVG